MFKSNEWLKTKNPKNNITKDRDQLNSIFRSKGYFIINTHNNIDNWLLVFINQIDWFEIEKQIFNFNWLFSQN